MIPLLKKAMKSFVTTTSCLISESSDENCIYINANGASILSLGSIHQILAIPHPQILVEFDARGAEKRQH